MNLRKRIWKIISDACVYFTVAEFFVLFVATGFSELDPEAGGGVGKYLSLGAAALLFLGCFLLSLLNLTFRLDPVVVAACADTFHWHDRSLFAGIHSHPRRIQ